MVYFSVRRVLTLSASHDDGIGTSSSTVGNGDGSRRHRREESATVMTTEQLNRWQDGFKWSAFAIQAGAFAGSVISFALANQ